MIDIEPTRSLDLVAISDGSQPEKRSHSRYIRDDIAIQVECKSFFSEPHSYSPKLLDVSLYGASIVFDKEIKRGKKVSLTMKFQDLNEFKLNGKIVYKSERDTQPVYGLEFEQLNTSFMEHLLKTGLKKKLALQSDIQ